MTLVDEYDRLFAERLQTRPVQYAGLETRAYFDQAGSIRSIGKTAIQVEEDTLYIRTGTIGEIVRDSQIVVGDIGAESAVGGMLYHINHANPIDDGLITAIALSGGDT